MTAVSVVLKPGASQVRLPDVQAGDSYALQFDPGVNVGRNGSVKVYTDGANLFEDHCTVTDGKGNVVWGQGTAGDTAWLLYSLGGNATKPQFDPTAGPYTLTIPCDVAGNARYDFNQPPTAHATRTGGAGH